MKGPGQRYVRTIFSKDGNFVLKEHPHGGAEEVISIELANGGGFYVLVCGHGEKPPQGDME